MEKGRVIVFGIFDGVHEGHRDFFRQAKEKGNELMVVVGRDAIALKLKHRTPRHSEQERLGMVRVDPCVAQAVLGDTALSMYRVIEQFKPDVICFGYDQKELKKDLIAWLKTSPQKLKIYTLKAYKPETFHSSLV